MNYWNTYSRVVSWNTVRLMLVTELINDWHTQFIEFELEFPQAPIKTDTYMKPPKVPKEFEIPDLTNFTDRFIYMYNIINNLYGLKDAGNTWY